MHAVHAVRTAADIDNAIQPASEIVARTGWPCIPEMILQVGCLVALHAKCCTCKILYMLEGFAWLLAKLT